MSNQIAEEHLPLSYRYNLSAVRCILALVLWLSQRAMRMHQLLDGWYIGDSCAHGYALYELYYMCKLNIEDAYAGASKFIESIFSCISVHNYVKTIFLCVSLIQNSSDQVFHSHRYVIVSHIHAWNTRHTFQIFVELIPFHPSIDDTLICDH